MELFNKKSTEKKIGILEFLQDQGISGIRFEWKKTIINFFEKRNISHEEIFLNKELIFLGKITKISKDEVITITIKHIKEMEMSIPMDYIENVTLQK